MEDHGTTKHDFVTETKGQCFFCSKGTSSSFQYSSAKQADSLSIHSLHCLASYLKVDMGKVFTGNAPIPGNLVERVNKSRLKAELCGDCAVLNERFFKIFRQLERVEMEVTSCLGIIHEKLKSAKTLGNGCGGSNDEWAAKLEISESLRKDTMHKCSRKLESVLPLTKIERLTWKQINDERRKMKSEDVVAGYEQLDPSSVPNYEHYDDAGSPASFPALGESYGGTDPEDNCLSRMDTGKEKMTEGSTGSDKAFCPIKIKVEHGLGQSNSSTNAGGRTSEGRNPHNNIEKNQLSRAIPPPLAISKGVDESPPAIIKNTETAKYNCPICSKEYAHLRGFQLHYKSSHLKMRYACGTCKTDFPQKKNYERHYLSIHMGVRFKCGKCNKTFTREDPLRQHQKQFH